MAEVGLKLSLLAPKHRGILHSEPVVLQVWCLGQQLQHLGTCQKPTFSEPLSKIRSSGEGPHKLFEQALQIILVLTLENHTVKQLLNKHYEHNVQM